MSDKELRIKPTDLKRIYLCKVVKRLVDAMIAEHRLKGEIASTKTSIAFQDHDDCSMTALQQVVYEHGKKEKAARLQRQEKEHEEARVAAVIAMLEMEAVAMDEPFPKYVEKIGEAEQEKAVLETQVSNVNALVEAAKQKAAAAKTSMIEKASFLFE